MIADAERQALIVRSLSDAKLDALVCTSGTEVLLLTGYWPIMANSVAVHTAGGEVAVLVPEDEEELARKTSSARVLPYKPAGLDSLASILEKLKEPLDDLLHELGLENARCGVRRQEIVQPATYAVGYELRPAFFKLLGEILPHATIVPADETIGSLLAVKTARELAVMKSGCAVAAAGFRRASVAIRAGLREAEVAAEVQSAFAADPGAEQFERSYGYFFCMSGPNSAKAAAAYARTRQRVLEEGDLVMIHANTCADGCWTDITRTHTIGEPPPRHQAMRRAILEAREAGLKAIRPGVTGREVDRAVRGVMEVHDFGKAFKHATGHGVGFAAANGHALPRIHPLSDDVLLPGMTFNVEPAAYFDGYGGMRHCDVVAVTDDGVEVLTDF